MDIFFRVICQTITTPKFDEKHQTMSDALKQKRRAKEHGANIISSIPIDHKFCRTACPRQQIHFDRLRFWRNLRSMRFASVSGQITCTLGSASTV
jgi:hypothetical protein